MVNSNEKLVNSVGACFLSITKIRIQEIRCFKKCHACIRIERAMWLLTLSIKTVNVMTGSESLHELSRNFSFLIVGLQIDIIYF